MERHVEYEIPEPREGTLAYLAWNAYQRRLFQISEQRRTRETSRMTLEDIRSRQAQEYYYRELDQQRNRGVITTEEYNQLRGISSKPKSKKRKSVKKKVTTKTDLNPPGPPRPPPPPPTGRFSALSIR